MRERNERERKERGRENTCIKLIFLHNYTVKLSGLQREREREREREYMLTTSFFLINARRSSCGSDLRN
jgi:hypothetical protein